ncbi:MAG: Uma2 family endonuclease [Polyangiales bacterium]
MPGEALRVPTLSYREYLAFERAENARYEWLDGQIYAMAGGTLSHAELATAVAAELRALALSCGCRVFSADAKVRVLATGLATYPDASVVCGTVARDPDDDHALTNPAMLVEVLSEGTERYDRGEKADHYRRIVSLKDYVLVSQHTARIEIHSREGDHWVLRVAGPGEAVPLTAMAGALSVDRVYQGVELTPTAR